MEGHSIIYVLAVFFVCLGAFLPLVQDSFDQPTYEYDTDGINDAFRQADGETEPTSFLTITWSVLTMFFWSTGGIIPVFVELIFLLPLRILFFYLLLKDVIVEIIPFT